MSISLTAQEPASRYDALKNALGLSDLQISTCQQEGGCTTDQRVLDVSQKSKLQAIVERALRSDAEGALANWLGLNDKVKWGLCACQHRIKPQASQLGFDEIQLAKLSELESAAKPALYARFDDTKQRWLELRSSGTGNASPAGRDADQLGQRMNDLLDEMLEPRLPRDIAFALLSDGQRQLAAALENTLLLIGEAIELNLLPRHYQVERGLCN